jgi:lipoprotein-releasing system permease protein
MANIFRFIAQRSMQNTSQGAMLSAWTVRLCVLGIALSLPIMGLSYFVLRGFQENISNQVRGFGGDLYISSYQDEIENSNNAIALSELNAILEKVPLAYYNAYAQKPVVLSGKTEVQGALAQGILPNFRWDFLKNYWKAGKTIQNKTETVISLDIAKNLGLRIGDTLNVFLVNADKQHQLKLLVVGMYQSGFSEFDRKAFFMDMSHLQKFNRWKSEADTLVGAAQVFLKNAKDLNAVKETLREENLYRFQIQSLEELYPAVFSWLSLIDQNVYLLLFLMLVVSVVNVSSTLLLLSFENRPRLAILATLGLYPLWRLMYAQGLYIVGKGFLYGNILLGLAVFLQTYFHVIKLPSEFYFMDYVPLSPSWQAWLGINVLLFVFCAIALIAPLRFAMRFSPAKVLAEKVL